MERASCKLLCNQRVSESDYAESELDASNSLEDASACAMKTKKRFRHQFKCWTFLFTLNADARALNGGHSSDSVTLQERQKAAALLEHIRSEFRRSFSRFVHIVWAPSGRYFNFHSNAWIYPDQSGKAHTNCEIITMQYWIPAAVCLDYTVTPVPGPGGLATNNDER